MRLWESINNRTEELMSLDMILMDKKVNLLSISLYSSVIYIFFAILLPDVFFFAEKCYSLYNLEEYD
jgi:hypothetical protein